MRCGYRSYLFVVATVFSDKEIDPECHIFFYGTHWDIEKEKKKKIEY